MCCTLDFSKVRQYWVMLSAKCFYFLRHCSDVMSCLGVFPGRDVTVRRRFPLRSRRLWTWYQYRAAFLHSEARNARWDARPNAGPLTSVPATTKTPQFIHKTKHRRDRSRLQYLVFLPYQQAPRRGRFHQWERRSRRRRSRRFQRWDQETSRRQRELRRGGYSRWLAWETCQLAEGRQSHLKIMTSCFERNFVEGEEKVLVK